MAHVVYFSVSNIVFLAVCSEILFEFVPTEEYLQFAHPIYYIAAAAFSIIFVICFRRARVYTYINFRRKGIAATSTRLLLTVLSLHVILSYFIYIFVLSTVPYYISVLSGSQVMHIMTVDQLNPNRDRKFCLSGVYIKNRPHFANEVCNINKQVLALVVPNSKIRVFGRGTWMGVIPHNFAIKLDD